MLLSTFPRTNSKNLCNFYCFSSCICYNESR
uniref:Uncharacterized protein n=1 Tax=Siphoviridae sp. ctlgF9 TaxID=2825649 RepID=A0A8S5PUY4_9CAUD|nr:MAG TPA: hypothetical protein [Siphoviridae sp. ctlgF9]